MKIFMNTTEKYYEKWIKNIAKTTSVTNIKRHIIHHAKELNNPEKNNPISWAASMYNLLKIYQSIHGVKSDIPIQIYKLLKKYRKNPKIYTPPPGNRVPKNVKIKQVKSNTN